MRVICTPAGRFRGRANCDWSRSELQVWISPNGGLADDYVRSIQGLSSNPEFVIVALLAIFALAHSGLAYLRPAGGLRTRL